MTSYSGMAARGREESLARTKGRRKVTAERIEYDEPDTSNVVALHSGEVLRSYTTVQGRLIGSCGHTLRWLAAVPVYDGETRPSYYLTSKLGRKMTCPHNDCLIPEKPAREPRETDCTWMVDDGTDDQGEMAERRCRVTAKWATDHGRLCTRHRNYLRTNGYLDDDGTPIP